MDIDSLFNNLFNTTKNAGLVARFLQPYVINTKKQTEKMENNTPLIMQMRDAKSIVDELVQELLLQCVIEIDGSNRELLLDVEEDTETKKLFSHNEQCNYSLIIDPIDGTLEYLEKMDKYSICTGIVKEGRIIMALVYFPEIDVFYFCPPNKYAMILRDAKYKTINESSRIIGEYKNKPNIIYKNSRVSQTIINRLEDSGYIVIDDTKNMISCPGAIIECIEGRALAYISHTRNLRDILLGAILSKSENGNAYDWNGNEFIWPMKGRVNRVLFSMYDLEKDFFKLLSE